MGQGAWRALNRTAQHGKNWLYPWWESLVDLIYPWPAAAELRRVTEPYCQQCGEPFVGMLTTSSICTNCRRGQWFITKARAMYRVEGEVRTAIHDFKYRRHFFRLRQLSAWLLEGYERFYRESAYDALVPVPLHSLRRRERGFNQATELASQLGKGIGLPVRDVLSRTKPTRTQANLRRSERLRNQLGAYTLKSEFDVSGKRLLIIDDVFTTGATINACAKVLHRAGARQIDALTVARG